MGAEVAGAAGAAGAGGVSMMASGIVVLENQFLENGE